MEPHLTRQPVRVAMSGRAEDGFLVFADGCLMAVVTHLQYSVGEEHRCQWYVEAGFGPCAVGPDAPVFRSTSEADAWVRARLGARTRRES